MRFSSPVRALVRPVSTSFRDALREVRVPLDPERARAQHAAYVQALVDAGVVVGWIDEARDHPDAVFVEDTAVVVSSSLALSTVPGAPSRRGERAGVRDALAGAGLAVRDQVSGTLDGGDVLRVGNRWFVGRTARTDRAGVAALRALVGDLVEVPVREGLHLKSHATVARPDLLVVDPRGVDPSAFSGLEVLLAEEPLAANVLALEDRVVVSAAGPRLCEQLEARGLRVVQVELSELHAADGALTCLSLRIPPPDGWCA